MPKWRLAKTEADHRAVTQLLHARRAEAGGDHEGDLASRSDTEEWLLGSPPVGVAVFSDSHNRWVLERLWIKPGHRNSGHFTRHGVTAWERRYGPIGLRTPHDAVRPMLRRRGWGPELHDAMAEAGLAKPGEMKPFAHDGVWTHEQTR